MEALKYMIHKNLELHGSLMCGSFFWNKNFLGICIDSITIYLKIKRKEDQIQKNDQRNIY
jgi:hypothetical protein